MELILLRHGTTEGNAKRQYVGSGLDQPLSPEGRALAERARAVYPPVERVFASPMLRTRQTASIVYPEQEAELVPGLQETHFGIYEGKTYEELKDDPYYQKYISGDPDIPCPGGESRREFAERCKAAFEALVKRLAAENVSLAAVVIHGGTMMALMSAFVHSERSFYDWMPTNLGGFRVKVTLDPLSLKVLEEYRPQ